MVDEADVIVGDVAGWKSVEERYGCGEIVEQRRVGLAFAQGGAQQLGYECGYCGAYRISPDIVERQQRAWFRHTADVVGRACIGYAFHECKRLQYAAPACRLASCSGRDQK